ncbi:hypothetical protein TIFTF001_024443 [Ficus carica]|uniref:Uncharacterized protein n=1 Tax=Ficus carica TaxID=3494 RepID=A0AA88AGQ4_FICCA|nr:hypothetical protein TIFTF001_024443 [Ficus carica]
MVGCAAKQVCGLSWSAQSSQQVNVGLPSLPTRISLLGRVLVRPPCAAVHGVEVDFKHHPKRMTLVTEWDWLPEYLLFRE